MTDKQTLLKKFKQLKADYIKAFKSGFISVCRKIGDELIAIATELRAIGLTFEGLGLSSDGSYIVRCIDLARTNPSDHSETLLNDAERLLEESIPIQRYTMRGFEVFEVDNNGKLSIPEPEPPKKFPEQPFRLPLRNRDIQREAGEN
jgi:Ca2+-binding EF-hand superfamily protein